MIRTATEIGAWWVAGTLVWWLTVPSVSVPEYAVGAVVAIPCAFVARWARIADDAAWTFDVRALRLAALLPGAVVGDSVRVLREVLRGAPSSTAELQLPVEAGHRAAGRRAAATWLLAATPGTVVLDADPARDTVVVHRIGRTSDRLTAAVTQQRAGAS